MIAEHGSAAAAIAALPEIARAAGVRDYAPCPAAAAEAELRAGERAGAVLLRWDAPGYPALLRDISDAPPLLWVKGDRTVLARPGIAVIGGRDASSLGLRMARGLSGALARDGIAIISGLARGIDTAAHEASVEQGCVAVMAGGIDVIYPKANARLADRICETGCLLTEQPPGMQPIARHFPLRNRIISGLSHGVVVVEAASRSGSLITAGNALDQGREVFAVPGHPVDGRAGGCNQLIRDGATLIRNADDVLAALPGLAGQLPALNPDAPATEPEAERADEGMLAGGATDANLARPRAPNGPQPDRADRRDRPETKPSTRHAHPEQPAGQTSEPPLQRDPARLEREVLAKLSPSPTDENLLIRDLGVPASVLAPLIQRLELSGKLTRVGGGQLAIA